MNFLAAIIFLAVVAATHGTTVPETSDTGMVFLGTWNGLLTKDGSYLPRDYYVNVQSRNWDEAQQECNKAFQNGNLVSIETMEEYKFLAKELKQHGAGRYYYIGAVYSTGRKTWIWDANLGPVPSFILNRLPALDYTPLQSIIINYQGPYEEENFDVISNSEVNPYICEVDRCGGCNP